MTGAMSADTTPMTWGQITSTLVVWAVIVAVGLGIYCLVARLTSCFTVSLLTMSTLTVSPLIVILMLLRLAGRDVTTRSKCQQKRALPMGIAPRRDQSVNPIGP